MDPESPGILTRVAYWLEHPWQQPVSFRTLALILALLILAIYFVHDGARLAREVVTTTREAVS